MRLLLALPLAGCLTTRTVGTTVERRPAGLRTLDDPAGEHLVVEEQPASDGVVQLTVSTARRQLEVQDFDVVQTTTQGHAWKKGGRVGRDLLWLGSAALGWVGAAGVSWQTADGRTVQIGGLGREALTWQGGAALLGALGGVGAGAQQTLAAHRPGSQSRTLLRREQVLVRDVSLPDAPLASQTVQLGLAGLPLLSTQTDPQGRAMVATTQLPVSAWRQGLELADDDLRGSWRPSDALRQGLITRPPDWDAPFYGSLLDEVVALAGDVEDSSGGLPISRLRTPEGARGLLAELPPEAQAPQVQAWIDDLEPLAQLAAAQRERVQLDWLRGAARATRQAVPVVRDAPRDMITPLFEPFDLFRQLPDALLLPVERLDGAPLVRRDPQVVLLEAGPCTVTGALGPMPPGRALVECGDQRVIVASDADLHLARARAWVLAGLRAPPVSLGPVADDREDDIENTRLSWVPVVRPLYAASLSPDDSGAMAFTQLLDEPALLDSGLLRQPLP